MPIAAETAGLGCYDLRHEGDPCIPAAASFTTSTDIIFLGRGQLFSIIDEYLADNSAIITLCRNSTSEGRFYSRLVLPEAALSAIPASLYRHFGLQHEVTFDSLSLRLAHNLPQVNSGSTVATTPPLLLG